MMWYGKNVYSKLIAVPTNHESPNWRSANNEHSITSGKPSKK